MTISPAKTVVVVFRCKSLKAAWKNTWTCDGDPFHVCGAWKCLGPCLRSDPRRRQRLCPRCSAPA